MRRTAVALLVMIAAVASADSSREDWPAPTGATGTVTNIVAIAEATCASGFFIDTDQDGSRDTGESCLNPSVPALGDQADGRNLSCDSTLGICPNPRSTLLLDTRIFFAAARGGNQDDDGSMWTGPGTANATTDWINSSTAIPAAAGAAGYNIVLSVAEDGDVLYCRDTTAFTPGPSGCTTCSSTMGSADPLPVVWKDTTTGLYEGLGMTTYSGCNAATGNVTFTTTRSAANAGTLQAAMPDGVHPGSHLSALIAQTLLAGTVELFEYPVSAATNMIANGDATSAATNWTEVGSGTVVHDAAEAIPADFNNGNFYNGGIQLTGRAANTDALLTPVMTTVAGRWYIAKGYARLNSTGTEDIVVQPWDVSGGAALATYQTYQVKGSHNIALTAGATTQDRQCYGGCYFIVKFLATDTDTAIAISSSSGTGVIYADNWIGMEAPTERLGLTPLFPNNGGIGIHVEGDSRSNDANDFADAIDDAIAAAVPRADFAAIDLVYSENTNATAGRSADDVVTAEAFSAIRPDTVGGRYTVVFIGINDLSGGTPATVAADWNAIADKIRQKGGRPIVVLEPPYRGNTNLTSCEGGTENCTTTIDELADLMMNSATGVLHQ